jgi:general stress protein YciG
MPKEQHLAIARAGGVAVPAEKRMFARDPALAKRAGSMGGKAARRKK